MKFDFIVLEFNSHNASKRPGLGAVAVFHDPSAGTEAELLLQ